MGAVGGRERVVSEPYTTLSIPSTMSFLNIIPERDEEPTRSERSFVIPRRTEENVLEAEGEAKKEEDEDNSSMHLSSIQ